MTEVWIHHRIPVEQPTIETQVYWTEGDIQKHGPIIDAPLEDFTTVRDAPLKPGIQRFGPRLVKQVGDLQREGFKPKLGDDAWVYELYLRIQLEVDGANVNVKWGFSAKNTQPFNSMASCC